MSATLLARDFTGRPAAVECDQPIDSQYFDASGFLRGLKAAPLAGGLVQVVKWELPQQYCGVLEYFAQFTDEHARDPSKVANGLRWQIRVSGTPLAPYHAMDAILNPWGNGSFQFRIRLPDRAVVEMLVGGKSDGIDVVGGRLVGRYWYNAANGGAR